MKAAEVEDGPVLPWGTQRVRVPRGGGWWQLPWGVMCRVSPPEGLPQRHL